MMSKAYGLKLLVICGGGGIPYWNIIRANVWCAGGTFALYALLCRHLKLSLILNQQAADEELSTYKLEPPSTASPRGEWFRRLLEKHKFLQNGLLIVVLLGTCMVIGDGALTPALSGS
jgi:KUP system potassium uptake protein